MSIESLIQTYGYLAVLVGTFLEGETILVIAGFMAHRGYLQLPWVVVLAFLGSMLGDQLCFFLGRYKGPQLIAGRPHWQRPAVRVQELLDRYQVWVLLGFRFLYGLRNLTPMVIGAAGFSPRRFVLFNALGALVWAVTVAFAGYLFGQAVTMVLDDVKKYELWVMLVLALGGASFWGVRFLLRRTSRCRPPTSEAKTP